MQDFAPARAGDESDENDEAQALRAIEPVRHIKCQAPRTPGEHPKHRSSISKGERSSMRRLHQRSSPRARRLLLRKHPQLPDDQHGISGRTVGETGSRPVPGTSQAEQRQHGWRSGRPRDWLSARRVRNAARPMPWPLRGYPSIVPARAPIGPHGEVGP